MKGQPSEASNLLLDSMTNPQMITIKADAKKFPPERGHGSWMLLSPGLSFNPKLSQFIDLLTLVVLLKLIK